MPINYNALYSATNKAELRADYIQQRTESLKLTAAWLSDKIKDSKDLRRRFGQLTPNPQIASNRIARKQLIPSYEETVPLCLFIRSIMDDEGRKDGELSFQVMWAGDCPEYRLPWIVNAFCELYSELDPVRQKEIMEHMKPWKRYTTSELFRTRLVQFVDNAPIEANMSTVFFTSKISFEVLNAATESQEAFNQYMSAKPKRNFNLRRQLDLGLEMKLPLDYFLTRDYLEYTWQYAVFQRSDNSEYRLSPVGNPNLWKAVRAFTCQKPEDQARVLAGLL